MEFPMAAVTEKSAGQNCLPGSPEADLAVQRVTAYFQSLGLAATNAAGWAERMVGDVRDDNRHMTDERVDTVGGCSGRAMARVDEWLAWIVASYPDSSEDLVAQLRWHLRPLLQQHPESFLRMDDLPDDLHRAVREAARSILPPSIPAVMPAQSFGDLPHLWPRIVNKLQRMWR
jgi:hypothetical protein